MMPPRVSCAAVQRAFDAATAVTALGDGRYRARIDEGWDIGGNANGGYLIALAARAIHDMVGRPPLSVTAHYLARGRSGPCEITVDVARAGRRTATAIARLRTDVEVILVLGTFADQLPGGPTIIDSEPPDLPPFPDCVCTVPPVPNSGFGARVHVRIRPSDAAFREGRPTETGEVSGWFTFDDAPPDEQRFDAFGLLQAADAFAPVCFNRSDVPLAWAPTLELTVHVRGVPAPGPLRCRFRNTFMQNGLFEEDGEIWDSAGTLVAQSRQLALIPRG
jgi:acyl-CoA thioesterase